MSSEHLASAQNLLKGNLAGAWDILSGAQGQYTDLGIARRFGGAAAAYSLRDIGAMNGRVVRVRRDSDDTEEDFSANQVASGALETFVQDGATQKGLTQSTWQNTGGETFSSTSTDGFSFSNSSGTAFIGVTLSETLALNDSVFVSFNASGVDIPDESPQIRLRDSVSGGSASSSLIGEVKNGFNSFELEYDLSQYSSGDNIVFSEGNTGGGIVTISDFKVFGVSRNGFVQTWYDQSGNFRPMIQDNASEQPSIVENGGFVGGVKAKAATSDDTMQNLQVSTDGTTANFGTDDWASGANSKLGLMYVGKIDEVAVNTTQSIILGGGRGVSSFQSGGLSLQVVKGGDDSYSLTNERQGLTPVTMTASFTLNTDDDMILYGIADNREFTLKLNSTTATETETADLDTRENQALSLFGAYSGFNTRRYQNSSGGVCKECYLFAGDNISEVDTIATEINKHYNIY